MLRKRNISFVLISISEADPYVKLDGCWIMIVECGSALRFPLVPAANKIEDIDLASPMHTVLISGFTWFMVSNMAIPESIQLQLWSPELMYIFMSRDESSASRYNNFEMMSDDDFLYIGPSSIIIRSFRRCADISLEDISSLSEEFSVVFLVKWGDVVFILKDEGDDGIFGAIVFLILACRVL